MRTHRKLRRAVMKKRKRRKVPLLPLAHIRYESDHAGGLGGKLPAYAWPGGYPIFYLTKKDDVLCPDCANAQGRHDDDPVVAHDANWEDPELYCEGCSQRIESAYAEDEVK